LHLQKNGKTEILKEIEDISNLADIHYIRQKEPLGLGNAILKAEKHIGNESFAVLLGDDIIVDKNGILQLMKDHEKTNCGIIGAEEVPFERISKYGVLDVEKVQDLLFVKDLVEKPKKEEAPSNLGIIGRYVLTPEIFDCIKRTKPGHGGEIQLTDALKLLLEKQKIYAKIIEGKRYDIGDKFNYVKAILDFALRREDLKKSVEEYIKNLILS